MDMNQYLEIFIEEGKEHLQSLNQSLLQLEKNPQDISMLNEIFRAAHTLKGMSATMGFNKMSVLTHDMENVLDELRHNRIKITPELTDLLFKCLDALEFYLNSIIETGSEGSNEYTEIIQQLNDAVNNKNGSDSETGENNHPKNAESAAADNHPTRNFTFESFEKKAVEKALKENLRVLTITVELDKGCLLKSARAFIVFQTLEKHADIIKSIPKVQDIEDEKFDWEFTVVVITSQDEQFIYDELNSISEIRKIIITPVGQEIMQNVDTAAEEDSADDEPDDMNLDEEKEKAANEQSAVHKTKTGKTVRVEINRLDVLINLVSELIIQKTRLVELGTTEDTQTFTETLEYLERITTSLHDAVMKVRMVPVETVFNRFPRMIRDISKELGKDIVLKMSGEETELDRTVIDEIGDPLIHLLRNSADHGIESLEERRAAGKPDTGTINLRAYQDGSNVIIEVEDDGRGIDLDKVRKKAVSTGLISKEAAKNMSEKDAIDLLFKPGFSTSDKITDISGRGVGLDVVKTKIEALGGAIDIETVKGKGSRSIIRLPLTLAIIQALLVRIGSEKYAIQLSAIQQIINITNDDIKMVQNQEVILLRNTVIPIIRLDKVLEVPDYDSKSKNQHTVVIVKKGDRLSGFLVDDIIGQQEIVQKSLGKLLSGIKTITSATILGDGNVALILDVNNIA